MTLVSEGLIRMWIGRDVRVSKMFHFLETDQRIQTYLQMANVMAVKRLGYNDHGPVHSRIASGAALKIFDLLKNHARFAVVEYGGLSDARVVTLCIAYLHDVGNSVHRSLHHMHGCYIADRVLNEPLAKVYGKDLDRVIRLKQEILQGIFSHDDRIQCLSLEAGIAKVADGTDMAKGRARIPYSLGKVDIHSLSALAITDVHLDTGEKRPLRIRVEMNNSAGIFQIEQVLIKKVNTSGLKDMIEVVAMERGKELKVIN